MQDNKFITFRGDHPGEGDAYVPFADPGIGAVTIPYGGYVIYNESKIGLKSIIVNTGGFYFCGSLNGNSILEYEEFRELTYEQMQASVILHELLHAAGVLESDNGAGQSKQNSMAVKTNCF